MKKHVKEIILAFLVAVGIPLLAYFGSLMLFDMWWPEISKHAPVSREKEEVLLFIADALTRGIQRINFVIYCAIALALCALISLYMFVRSTILRVGLGIAACGCLGLAYLMHDFKGDIYKDLHRAKQKAELRKSRGFSE